MDANQFDLVLLQADIQSREKLPIRYAALLAASTQDFDARLLPAVQAWMNQELRDDFSVDGCSLLDIREDTGASQFEALCMLNLQLKNPERIDAVLWEERRDMIIDLEQ